jgi:DNA-binding protein HU-beta
LEEVRLLCWLFTQDRLFFSTKSAIVPTEREFIWTSILDERDRIMTETKATEVVGKQELVKRVAQQANVSQKEAGSILDATLTAIKDALQSGEEVRLIGFGSFTVKQTAERNGINPQSHEPMVIPAKDRVRFSPGKELAEAVQK